MMVGSMWPGRWRPQSPSMTAPDTSCPYMMTGTPALPGTTMTGPDSDASAAGVATRLPANNRTTHHARIDASQNRGHGGTGAQIARMLACLIGSNVNRSEHAAPARARRRRGYRAPERARAGALAGGDRRPNARRLLVHVG